MFIQTVEGPLSDILGHTNHGVTSYPIFSTSPTPQENRFPEERTLSFMIRDRTPNQSPDDPIWQQEADPWQGTARAVPKPPPPEASQRLAPKAKAAPEQPKAKAAPEQPQNKPQVLRRSGQTGPPLLRKVLNHQTLVEQPKQANRLALLIPSNHHGCDLD